MTESTSKFQKELMRRKFALILIIALTCLIPLVFISPPRDEFELSFSFVLAKVSSLTGTVLLYWQFILGYRIWVSKIIKDMGWVIDLHKKLGKYGSLFVLIHPIFITLYYMLANRINLLKIPVESNFDLNVLYGKIALGIIILIVVSSTILRAFLKFWQWRRIHQIAYFILPLAIIHSLALGSTIGGTDLYYIWVVLSLLFAFLVFARLLNRLGFLTTKYSVVSVKGIANDISEITLTPISSKQIVSEHGQFAYFRKSFWESANPFSVMKYDLKTGNLVIGIKSLGPRTSQWQSIDIGQEVFVDGPYGVFGQQMIASPREIVMIAGGIGITPFVSLFNSQTKKSFLFYGVNNQEELAYKDDLNNAGKSGNVFVPVIRDNPEKSEEGGYINTDLLKKYIGNDLNKYDYFLCGPPVMIKILEKDFAANGINKEQIFHELFSW